MTNTNKIRYFHYISSIRSTELLLTRTRCVQDQKRHKKRGISPHSDCHVIVDHRCINFVTHQCHPRATSLYFLFFCGLSVTHTLSKFLRKCTCTFCFSVGNNSTAKIGYSCGFSASSSSKTSSSQTRISCNSRKEVAYPL